MEREYKSNRALIAFEEPINLWCAQRCLERIGYDVIAVRNPDKMKVVMGLEEDGTIKRGSGIYLMDAEWDDSTEIAREIYSHISSYSAPPIRNRHGKPIQSFETNPPQFMSFSKKWELVEPEEGRGFGLPCSYYDSLERVIWGMYLRAQNTLGQSITEETEQFVE